MINAMTEQEKAELIESCRHDMRIYVSDSPRYKTAEIALASLTAKTIHQIETVNNEWVDVSKDAFDSSKSDRRVLYAAPPVPALTPVKLPESQHLDGNGYGYYFDMNDVFVALEEAGIKFEEAKNGKP